MNKRDNTGEKKRPEQLKLGGGERLMLGRRGGMKLDRTKNLGGGGDQINGFYKGTTKKKFPKSESAWVRRGTKEKDVIT